MDMYGTLQNANGTVTSVPDILLARNPLSTHF